MKYYATLQVIFFTFSTIVAQNKWSAGLTVQGGFSGYKSQHSEQNFAPSGLDNSTFGYTEKRRPQRRSRNLVDLPYKWKVEH